MTGPERCGLSSHTDRPRGIVCDTNVFERAVRSSAHRRHLNRLRQACDRCSTPLLYSLLTVLELQRRVRGRDLLDSISDVMEIAGCMLDVCDNAAPHPFAVLIETLGGRPPASLSNMNARTVARFAALSRCDDCDSPRVRRALHRFISEDTRRAFSDHLDGIKTRKEGRLYTPDVILLMLGAKLGLPKSALAHLVDETDREQVQAKLLPYLKACAAAAQKTLNPTFKPYGKASHMLEDRWFLVYLSGGFGLVTEDLEVRSFAKETMHERRVKSFEDALSLLL